MSIRLRDNYPTGKCSGLIGMDYFENVIYRLKILISISVHKRDE
jgi:hypothetical protein